MLAIELFQLFDSLALKYLQLSHMSGTREQVGIRYAWCL